MAKNYYKFYKNFVSSLNETTLQKKNRNQLELRKICRFNFKH